MKKIESIEEYYRVWQESTLNPEKFWEQIAQTLYWEKMWEQTLEWNFSEPHIEWFKGGRTNLCYNALDRHLEKNSHKNAIIWEPGSPQQEARYITYLELYNWVNRIAKGLINLGVKPGDKVCIYMPVLPESAAVMLACARIGAVHNVVFAGFSSPSLAERIHDSGSKIIITADGFYRGGKEISLKKIVDVALIDCVDVEKCIVYPHLHTDIYMKQERDIFWQDFLPTENIYVAPFWCDSEHPLFILYTSGSTGKPKGILHTTGGYMVYSAYTSLQVFQFTENEIFFCTADIGWITGHTYGVYGPLLNGITTVLTESVPTWPDASRFWKIVENCKVSTFYTAPTAIRSLELAGNKFPQQHNLSSLKKLGSVGEPINEEAWQWYYTYIGKENCPVTDTWWQTETGGIMIASLCGVIPHRPAYATLPLPGIQPVIVDEKGHEISEMECEGILCIKFPWPGMARSIYNDHLRFKNTYFTAFEGLYFTGDGAKREKNGYIRITGRVDDVINVSGHRIGTGELEDIINQHTLITESAVVGFPHPVKGTGILTFVTGISIPDSYPLLEEIHELVAHHIGSFAKPDRIIAVSGLPKTRSGKIMRRILRKIAAGETEHLGDTSTLTDPAVVNEIYTLFQENKNGSGQTK